MATTEFSGPIVSAGAMTTLLAGTYGSAVPDYNPDAGPCIFYQGDSIPDVRVLLFKDRLNGFTGVQPAFFRQAPLQSVDAVPSAFGTAKIAALQHITNGTAMTLVTAGAAGITLSIPIIPTAGAAAGTVVTAPIVLDYGFSFLGTTAGSKTVVVADSTAFTLGMPLVIGSGTVAAPQITFVTGTPTPTSITINDPAVATATPVVGTGNAWPGGLLGNVYSSAHMPYVAGGPGLFLDPGQALSRGVSVTASGGTGGNVTVSGYDIYFQPMTEVIAVTAGAVTVYGKKAFKAISKVVPAFTDGTNNYSIGTSDVFGYHFRTARWELTDCAWAGNSVTTATGWTSFALPAVGDVRGTFQASAIGGGTGFSATSSNGVVTNKVMTGNRVFLMQGIGVGSMVAATPAQAQNLFGSPQT